MIQQVIFLIKIANIYIGAILPSLGILHDGSNGTSFRIDNSGDITMGYQPLHGDIIFDANGGDFGILG